MSTPRPFRFGLSAGPSAKRAKLLDAARAAEAVGFSTFGLADHFFRALAPLIACQAVADATTTLRVTQTVLAQDFRNPAVLAKELATLDVLSEGRLQIGLGAGWMRQEYEQAGLTFESASVRIERLEETAIILRALFADEPATVHGKHFDIAGLNGTPKPIQRPAPPIMIGGGGRKLLSAAARQADIVQLMPSNRNGQTGLDPTQFTPDAIEEKVSWIEDAAGSRFADIELSAQLLDLAITDHPEEHLGALRDRILEVTRDMGAAEIDLGSEDLRRSPIVAVGSIDEVCEKLIDTRERYGISYLAAPIDSRPEMLAPVIERLAGK